MNEQELTKLVMKSYKDKIQIAVRIMDNAKSLKDVKSLHRHLRSLTEAVENSVTMMDHYLEVKEFIESEQS